MKKLYPLLSVLFLIYWGCEDYMDNEKSFIEFTNLFGEGGDDGGFSVEQTTDGGYIITGYTWSYGNGEEDIWLIKTDGQGNEEWNQTFGGSEDDGGLYVEQTMDGGYIITGYLSNDENNYDVRLIKTDGQGNEEWRKTFGDGRGNSVQQTVDGGFIVTGRDGYGDVLLFKTNELGNI